MTQARPYSGSPSSTDWSGFLSAPGTAQASAAAMPLHPAEAARLARYRDRLLAAWDARDRDALHTAKQAVLRTACASRGATPAFMRAIRQLAWRMAALRLARSRTE
ncbi:hypothetical protein [Paracidovorax avenae]|uniref:hypothetical protein n=1 Tax=Paracidovorax avenae TaxID=80867 RepID=UPI000D175745|nr:hypothetical protein [Paracidovorax avenae]AVS83660.1 hypothetical protein C8239_01895 [Paracidovorax avenae]AVS87086.1 hypothetical protein C8238_01445 [Paracidovorax avenae]AVS94916.1 hypothetical protein C8232_00520 [Paracidovorax avenae]AVT01258.1 hypothetical protein C8243_01270 [Paracidovorax avenae]AVT08333.1 hypothetical protein C8242_01635 [Paracidovorax avenae]